MLHEWSHELLHKGETKTLARERKEAQAEATAYVVSQHFGLTHPFAADYSSRPEDASSAGTGGKPGTCHSPGA